MRQYQQSSTQLLPFVSENVEVMKRLASWLSDDQGELDLAKAAELACMMHPDDAPKASEFQDMLSDAWAKQGVAIRHAAAVSVGI